MQGVLDRFGQIGPAVLVAADGYAYGGKTHDTLARVAEVARALPTLRRTVVVPHIGAAPDVAAIAHARLWPEFLASNARAEPALERFPFDHPLYILYSSGTTGVPKCIVHGAGGTLLQHLKEHQLHYDVKRGDRVFYFTTCGWMMWNWLVTALASEATLLLWDGSPVHPSPHALFDFADETGMTLFGTSARFIDAARKAGLIADRNPQPADRAHDDVDRIAAGARELRLRLSEREARSPPGLPVRRHRHRQLFRRRQPDRAGVARRDPGPRAGNEGRGVRRRRDGRCGSRRESWSARCRSHRCRLVSGTIRTGAKYRAAYFERYPGVWHHGDYVELTEHDGVIIYGRSDAVLNPGGVRIGTAEIYRQVQQVPEVVESLVIAQQWEADERIVLFVRLRDGLMLTPDLHERIRQQIRRNATPRHVPARVVQVTDIPRTKSGKIVELAVRDVVHGRQVANREAMANPEALDQFRDRAELRE